MVLIMETTKENEEILSQDDVQPLRDNVVTALNKYFNQIGDTPMANLYDLVLGEIEAPMLRAVLEYTNHNQSKAALLLGLSRGTLRKKLKQHDIIS